MPHSGAVFLAARAILAVLPLRVYADEGLSVEAELLRPGVRLLVVEFYATWCKPCMEAVLKWKALHEKYRDQGLRLVVVAVQDDGRCVNPGWSPDCMVCDEDGRISDAFRVGQNLPAAFLWSWNGKLLVQRGTEAQVAAAVDAELATMPRVTLATDRTGPDAAALGEAVGLLRSELRKTGKVEVIASIDEQKMLEQMRRESQKAGYAENMQCKLGEQIAANSMLKVSLQRTGKEPKLHLQLFSAEKGCLTQSGLARWTPDNPDLAVAEAVGDLLARLHQETQMTGTAERAPLPFGGRQIEWGRDVDADTLDEAVVDFDCTPHGAAVFVGEKMICQQTPCSNGVSIGRRTVTMSVPDDVTRTETLEFGKEIKTLQWPLAPDFALLTVECNTPRLKLKLDGKPWGTCPQRERRVAPGKHILTLDSPCHLGVEEKLQLGRGHKKLVSFPAEPRLAALTIKARDDKGNDLRALATLDGETLGDVPGSFKVPMCGKKLDVNNPQLGVWRADVELHEGEKHQVVAELQSTRLEISAPETGGRVRVDGVIAGRTPIVVQVTPGRHSVDLEDERFSAPSQQVEVAQGDRRGVRMALRQKTHDCVRVSRIRLTGWQPDDEVRVKDRLRRISAPELEVDANNQLEIKVLRAGFGPWVSTIQLEPGQVRDVPVSWHEVQVVGPQSGDRLLADTRRLQINDARVQWQAWPKQLVWQRGDVQLPVPQQAFELIRLPAGVRVKGGQDGLMYTVEGQGKPPHAVGEHAVPVNVGVEQRVLFQLEHHVTHPFEVGRLRVGEVIDLKLTSDDFVPDPAWDAYEHRTSVRKWGAAATWVGGIALVGAGVALMVALSHEHRGDDATARFKLASDTTSAQQARVDASSAYASAASWRNVTTGATIGGGTLLVSGVGVLLGLPSLPVPSGDASAKAGGQ